MISFHVKTLPMYNYSTILYEEHHRRHSLFYCKSCTSSWFTFERSLFLVRCWCFVSEPVQGLSILHHHHPMMICLMRQIQILCLRLRLLEIGVCSFGKLNFLGLHELFFLALLPRAFVEDS